MTLETLMTIVWVIAIPEAIVWDRIDTKCQVETRTFGLDLDLDVVLSDVDIDLIISQT